VKHFHASLAALIGRAEASVHQSHQSHQRSSGDPQAPRLQLDACGAPGSWKQRAGAVWTVGNSRRLINPKSHSRMYHHSAIRAHAWPPRLQKVNATPALAYGTAQQLTRQYAEMLMDPLCVLQPVGFRLHLHSSAERISESPSN
jgi:hypothetical protein